PVTIPPKGTDQTAPERQMRTLSQHGRHTRLPRHPPENPRETRTATRLGHDHAKTAQENPRGLPQLLRRHPLDNTPPNVHAVSHRRAGCLETGTSGSEGGHAEKDLPRQAPRRVTYPAFGPAGGTRRQVRAGRKRPPTIADRLQGDTNGPSTLHTTPVTQQSLSLDIGLGVGRCGPCDALR